MKKIITSFTSHITADGQRISFTYSEVDENTGELIAQNERKSFIVVNDDLQSHIDSIDDYIVSNYLD